MWCILRSHHFLYYPRQEPEEYLNEEALEGYKAKQSGLRDDPSKHDAVEVRGNYVSDEVVKEPEVSKRILRGSKKRGSKRKRSS